MNIIPTSDSPLYRWHLIVLSHVSCDVSGFAMTGDYFYCILTFLFIILDILSPI